MNEQMLCRPCNDETADTTTSHSSSHLQHSSPFNTPAGRAGNRRCPCLDVLSEACDTELHRGLILPAHEKELLFESLTRLHGEEDVQICESNWNVQPRL